MSRKIPIRFKLNDEEWQVVRDFCLQLDMAPETFARQAVFLAIQQSYARAEQAQKQALAYLAQDKQLNPAAEKERENAAHNTTSGISTTNTTETRSSTDAGSTALADETSVAGTGTPE